MKAAAVLFLALSLGAARAQSPSAAIDEYATILRDAARSQSSIDRLHEQAVAAANERYLVETGGVSEVLAVRELEYEISRLEQRLFEIETDLQSVSETRAGVAQLLASMTDSLARFIELDLPFDLDSRRQRIQQLQQRAAHHQPAITSRYQSVLAAYLAEIAYGQGTQVHTMQIETPSGLRLAEVVRIGRIGLWYVSTDGTTAGRWDPQRRRWQPDPLTDPLMVKRAVRAIRDGAFDVEVRLPVDVAQQ